MSSSSRKRRNTSPTCLSPLVIPTSSTRASSLLTGSLPEISSNLSMFLSTSSTLVTLTVPSLPSLRTSAKRLAKTWSMVSSAAMASTSSSQKPYEE